MRQVYKSCNLGFESTRYVEAHGTGTQIGDSTEMKAIGGVFRNARSPNAPLYVGSVKANLGHLEGGSGLAGVLKCIMILEKGVIPPNPLFEKLNPKINARWSNIQVPTSCIPWPSSGLRRVSINSFGFGGSNGHVIMDDAYHTLEALSLKSVTHVLASSTLKRPVGYELTKMGNVNGDIKDDMTKTSVMEVEEPKQNGAPTALQSQGNFKQAVDGPVDHSIDTTTSSNVSLTLRTNGTTTSDSSGAPCKYQLLVYSARDEAALKRVLQQYGKYYDESIKGSTTRLQNLAYTLAARRSMMTWRSFTVGNADLQSDAINLPNSDCYPVFMSVMIEADKVFQSLGADWSLFDKIENGEGINLPQFSQPLCTALQIALVELLKSFHVAPVAVVGHSSGEIAAAYAIGALTFESACTVAYHRGRLSGQLVASTKAGTMMSVNLPEGNVRAYLEKVLAGADIHVACVNSPLNVTLAGVEADIDVLKEHLDNDGIFGQKLKTGIAYHTPVMQQIASEYLSCLDLLEHSVPANNTTLMVSSVTGEKISPSELSTGQYWVDNLVSPVRFVDALQYLTQAAPKLDGIKAISDYIEIGPHGALRRPVTETLSQVSTGKESRYASMLSKFDSALKTTMEVAGRLFTRGYPISVTAVNQHAASTGASLLIDTPKYPFDHSQRYWHETRLSRDWRLRGSAPRSVLGIRSTDWNPLEPRWRKMLSLEEAPWMAGHVVDGSILFPAAGTVVMALEAVRQTVPAHQTISGYLVKEATFISPIFVRPERRSEILLQLRAIHSSYEKTSLLFEAAVFSLDGGNWNECFKAIIHATVKELPNEVDRGLEARAAEQTRSNSYEHAKISCTNHVTKQDFYKGLENQNLSYGDVFALAEDIFWDGHESKLSTSSIGLECSFTALADDGSLLCHAKHLDMSAVANRESKGEAQKKLLHSIDWKPQLSLLTRDQLFDYCNVDKFAEDETAAADYCIRLEDALRTYLQHNLTQLQETVGSKTPAHLKHFVSWIERQLYKKPGRSTDEISDGSLSEELENLRAIRPSWRIFVDVARALVSIVQGETDALELLFSTPLAQDLLPTKESSRLAPARAA
ncbi:hypothetical protein DL765_008917 [Monosporascus sp. GIB2]|nr:hypothetical protein DL765_008917 [Monosporascus sp. GIB2]